MGLRGREWLVNKQKWALNSQIFELNNHNPRQPKELVFTMRIYFQSQRDPYLIQLVSMPLHWDFRGHLCLVFCYGHYLLSPKGWFSKPKSGLSIAWYKETLYQLNWCKNCLPSMTEKAVSKWKFRLLQEVPSTCRSLEGFFFCFVDTFMWCVSWCSLLWEPVCSNALALVVITVVVLMAPWMWTHD